MTGAEGATVRALVHNKLGVPCEMLLDFGDHQVRAPGLEGG